MYNTHLILVCDSNDFLTRFGLAKNVSKLKQILGIVAGGHKQQYSKQPAQEQFSNQIQIKQLTPNNLTPNKSNSN